MCIEKQARERSPVLALLKIFKICGTVAPTLSADAAMDKKRADIEAPL